MMDNFCILYFVISKKKCIFASPKKTGPFLKSQRRMATLT